MKFVVEKEIFEKLPNAFFGVVMAKGIDNSKEYPEIARLLEESIKVAAERFEGKKVKEEADISRTNIFALLKRSLRELPKAKACRTLIPW